MTQPLLSVIVPSYKTPELTKICLRLLRSRTDCSKIRIIVIDNDSQDESVAYLKKLEWITFVQRQVPEGEEGFVMHAKALDEAFKLVTTPFVMIMHTDTFILRSDWLDYICGSFSSPEIAAVGSWKLEAPRSLLFRAAHAAESWFRRLFKKNVKTEIRYLRSHCAVYRTELVRRYTDGFYDGESAGKAMHLKLEQAGFRLLFLPSDELGKFICHLNHATMILNPGDHDRKTGKAPARNKLGKKIRMFREILNRPDLDF